MHHQLGLGLLGRRVYEAQNRYLNKRLEDRLTQLFEFSWECSLEQLFRRRERKNVVFVLEVITLTTLYVNRGNLSVLGKPSTVGVYPWS